MKSHDEAGVGTLSAGVLTQVGAVPTEERSVAGRSVARRSVDLVGAVTLGIATVPLVIAAACISLMVYRAWPFFSHDRVGPGGRDIRVRKIRTLPPDTSHYAPKYDLAGCVLPRSMKMVRALHIDEFPQLWNVLRGDMTFIGPRPEMRFLHARLPRGFAATRLSIAPGVTGLWQISHASRGLIEEHPEFDVFYVGHRNLRLDLWISYRTAVKMLTGRTVGLDQIPGWALDRALAEESSATAA